MKSPGSTSVLYIRRDTNCRLLADNNFFFAKDSSPYSRRCAITRVSIDRTKVMPL